MADDNNFDFTPKDNQVQKQRTVQIPTEVLDNLEALDMEVLLNLSETELSMGRNWTHSRLLPKVAKKKKECLRGRETSLSFDVPFMKRSF